MDSVIIIKDFYPIEGSLVYLLTRDESIPREFKVEMYLEANDIFLLLLIINSTTHTN